MLFILTNHIALAKHGYVFLVQFYDDKGNVCL